MSPRSGLFEQRESLNLRFWIWASTLTALAASLRFYRLDTQLWLDEIAALQGYQKPFLEILTTFPGYFPNPLYELLAHASLLLVDNVSVAIRLPAVLFGVAGIFMFYRLVHRFFAREQALLAGALLAVSYHHIFFSQNARGYTVFLFFAIWATDLSLTLLEDMRWRRAFLYAAVAALTVYAHPFGVFVPAGQILLAMVVVWRRSKRSDYAGPTVPQVLSTGILTNVIVLALYTPYIQESIVFSLTTAREADHGPRVFGLGVELFEGLRDAFHGWAGVVVAGTLAAIGTVQLLGKHPVPLGMLTMPLLLSILVAGVLGVGVHPRYFLLALPLGYLVGTTGIIAIGRALLARFFRLSTLSRPVGASLATLLVIVATLPLFRYYAYPKQDYLGAIHKVRLLAEAQDRIFAADLAANAIRTHYERDFPGIRELDDLLREESTGHRVWVVTTLERVMAKRKPALISHLRQNYRLVRVLPGSVGDGAMRIYVREGAQEDGLAR